MLCSVGWLDNNCLSCRLQWTLTFWVNGTFLNSFLHNDMSNDPTKTKQVKKKSLKQFHLQWENCNFCYIGQQHPSIQNGIFCGPDKNIYHFGHVYSQPASCSLTQWGKTVIDGWYQRILLFVKILHHLSTVHSVLREIKMFKNSYIVVINVEIRLVCVHRPKTAFLDLFQYFFEKKNRK